MGFRHCLFLLKILFELLMKNRINLKVNSQKKKILFAKIYENQKNLIFLIIFDYFC